MKNHINRIPGPPLPWPRVRWSLVWDVPLKMEPPKLMLCGQTIANGQHHALSAYWHKEWRQQIQFHIRQMFREELS